MSLKNKDPPEVAGDVISGVVFGLGLFVLAEMKREIAIWKRTARHMRVVSLEERGVRDMLLRKAEEVQMQLREQLVHQ